MGPTPLGPTVKLGVVTLFPEMFGAVTAYGVTGRAVSEGRVNVAFFNPRDFTEDRHQTVDHRPYGGGPGMVMMIEPLRQAIAAARAWARNASGGATDGSAVKVVYLSPQGRVLDHQGVEELRRFAGHLILVAGRYEGIDERLLELEIDEEWSIGDYVLSGGELPAMVLMDAIIRRLPGVLGHEQSAQQDSFVNGLLDCPHYTRPENYAGHRVPQVLVSGDHERIRRWRLQQALGRTWLRRPEMLATVSLDREQRELLDEYRSAIVGTAGSTGTPQADAGDGTGEIGTDET